ncbi:beta-galactosidase-like protein [Haloactinopolyspora alba]|uniref:Beta-galactosidase-like protein n=1 Tax=Haloactinopolyspora alba TaxID=648780 RepID=A0A2P8DGR1_9ACTN|nr:family 78 glycoside hydrolase catalytic domain [Haloactinopolyspora alba]PSK96405.1 beta-galactosidase-like protein [Haloactinopolyspora alba]
MTTNHERPWTGYWVWSADDGNERNQWRRFRATFDAGDRPNGLRLRITAEFSYQAWLNGELIGEGPPASTPDYKYVDEYDLDPRSGSNTIAVLVHHLGVHPHLTRGGLLAEIVDGQGRVVSATGADWRVDTAHEYAVDTPFFHANKLRPFAHVLDTRKLGDPDWRSPEFDDTAWPAASLIGAIGSIFGPEPRPGAALPWTRLVTRDIPFPRRRIAHPVQVTTVEECTAIAHRHVPHGSAPLLSQAGVPVRATVVDGADGLTSGGPVTVQCSTDHLRGGGTIMEPCLTLDFGRVITGHVVLTVDGPAGVTVDLGYVERLIDGRFNNSIEAPFADRFVTAGGRQELRTHDWQAFRYLRLRVYDAYEPMTIDGLRAEIVEYPFERRGTFRSGDAGLDTLFEISRDTIQLCSIDAIMDTPWRESAQWVGDVAAVTLGGIYSCFGDTALAAKFLRQSAAGQMPSGVLPNVTNVVFPPHNAHLVDYSLWWVLALWEYYRYTADAEIVHELYPVAVRVLQYFAAHVDPGGLVADLSDPIFVDWAAVERRGANATVNALFSAALRTVAEMADLKGDAWTGHWARDLDDGVRTSFQKRLFDAGRGVVVDADIDGQLSETVSEQGNAAALLWDLLDDDTAASVIRTLWEKDTQPRIQAEPFFTSVVLRALARHRRYDLGLGIVRDRWVRLMVDQGATSTWEQWSTDGDRRSGAFTGFLRSLSHAWSAYPAEFLIRDLLAIRIVEPGCHRITLDPAPEMPDAEVAWPTPFGDVQATHRSGATTLRVPDGITVDVPEGADVTVLKQAAD